MPPLNVTANEANYEPYDNDTLNTGSSNTINQSWSDEITDFDLAIEPSDEEVLEKPLLVEQFLWNWFRTLDKIVFASFAVSVLPTVFSFGIVTRVCRNKVNDLL